MEICNIAHLISLKCEVSSHYNSNCLLWQLAVHLPWWIQRARTCAEIQSGARPGFVYSTHRTAVSTKNIVLQNIIRNCTVNLHFSVLCIWSIDGNCVVRSRHPSVINGPVTKFNPLKPNDTYRGRTAPLTSKSCILYIYSTNIGTEYFKHGIYSPFFPLQNAVCFIILTYLVPVLFTFYIQGVLKLKK